MKGMRLDDLPPALREQALAQMAARAVCGASAKKDGKSSVRSALSASRGGKTRGTMNRTEAKYLREMLDGVGLYESITLRLPGGSRYTPDFMTVDAEGRVTLHEVKGAYRFHSEGRARTAFRECAAAFPMFRFVWAKWNGKDWRVDDLTPAQVVEE